MGSVLLGSRPRTEIASFSELQRGHATGAVLVQNEAPKLDRW